eukprot:TRINITY_DN3276_c0_g1_i2.p1 TRINITY_DN3276_c0_g1~~TRINITY_DN3276_c0_g1_i2.p1  ORF type:complete len:787 (+),score=177.89 TRINITY_DN3276_c0_g1_i2:28-2388(+)
MAFPATGATTDANNIRVVARFRPQNKLELQTGGNVCVGLDGTNVEVKISDGESATHRFQFDSVFGPETPQEEVFQKTGQQIVEDVFKGYNGTIFVYGQTGSGKTFTMMGPNTSGLQGYCDDESMKGIIPRVVDMIFSSVESAEDNIEFTIKVSYIEIYMERIRDLLDVSKQHLQLHEDFRSARGVYVQDATEAYVSDASEVFGLLAQGAKNRVTASTRMNDESSRSHSIFCITITQKHSIKLDQRTGKLFLVDLAGSEKVGKTKAEGQQLEEAKLINKSLTTLGMVINSLTDKKSTHVPYRDSKLTRLLQDSLGGNSRTTLIICCSISRYNDQETLSTCRFGERAKTIKNKAKINRELTAAELKLLLAKAEKEIAQLKLMKGIALPAEEAQRAQQIIEADPQWQEERQILLEEKEIMLDELMDLRERTEKQDQLITQLKAQLEGLTQEDEIWELEYEVLQKQFEDVQFFLEKERSANKEKTSVIQKLLEATEEITREMHGLKTQITTLRGALEVASVGESAHGDSELQRLRAENEVLRTQLGLPPVDPTLAAAQAPSGGDASLLKDIQHRFEHVNDLELSLAEVQNQYKQLQQSDSVAAAVALKKRVMLLEQSNEQHAESFQELHQENSTLRLEMQLAEKKLAIRNERIENLKAGLKEEKRHLKELQDQFNSERERFKSELARYKEELNYWKDKCLTREKGVIGGGSGAGAGGAGGKLGGQRKNVVKILRGGARHSGSGSLVALAAGGGGGGGGGGSNSGSPTSLPGQGDEDEHDPDQHESEPTFL